MPEPDLEAFDRLIGSWTAELTHPLVEGTVVQGTAAYEWLEGRQFVIQRTTADHELFPDAICVIGVMEGEEELSMQYFDSRGVHRVYAIAFDGTVLTTERNAPGFAQRSRATLSADGSTLEGAGELNRDDQGFGPDLAFVYRRADR